MIEFKGFPVRMQYTPVPNLVFSALLPGITDVSELKILLHIFEILYPKKGNLRFVTHNELINNSSVRNDLKDSSGEQLKIILETLVGKAILLHLHLTKENKDEEIYFLNTEANRMSLEQIQRGEIVLPDFKYSQIEPPNVVELPDIFTLYEQNIGMLTPLIADELREAEEHYPESWIKDAIKEAVASNKRNWRYIARILENWSTKGRDDGTYRGNIKKNADPDKYIRGKYGHMVQR
jgi:DNA replication protein